MNNSCERQIEIGIANEDQTIPSCNDCAATIFTTRIPRIRKYWDDVSSLREETKALFARIPESGGVSAENCNSLFFELLASGDVMN